MKTGLVILLLFLGCSLKAPPLPPPPNRSAGSPPDTRMYFTNANHDVVTTVSRVPVPDFSRPTYKSITGKDYVPPYTNTIAKLAAEQAKQAAIYRDRVDFYKAGAALTLCLVWGWWRGTLFAIGRRYIGFVKRKEDAFGFWLLLSFYFAFNLFLYYMAICHGRP
ncbi:MAG TPA: hypothetical protein VK815_11625 [Candidatus Acidoferrales bacterium]|jgi:hypothetical protein|nr:hypothetical protein [Candidatus Acidoferrales bacterium]